MKIKFNLLRFALFFLFIISTITYSQTVNFEEEKKINELFSQFDTKETPGAAIVLVKDGKIILKGEYGMADLEHNIPITSSTVFHIGSVSKQFTGYSILLLEKQGNLKLNDKIIKYLPELPECMSKITIRQLLNHTSGIREQENLFDMCGISNSDVYSNENTLEFVKNQKELNFTPGEELEYCNTGFILAAIIIERITGKNLRDWAEENIFRPLEMVNTQFNDDNGRIIKNFSRPYFVPTGTDQIVKGILSSYNIGSTGITTTISDIAKWLIHFGDPQIGGQAVMNKMLTDTSNLPNGVLVDYSYGLAVTNYKGVKVNFHSGGDSGYRAFDAYFPEFQFGIAVLSNFYSINPQKMGFEIAEIYLKDKFTNDPELKNQKVKQSTTNEEKINNITLTKEELNNYIGKYLSEELETQFAIILNSDSLILKNLKNPAILLTPLGNDKFEGEYPMSVLHFVRGIDNKITGFKVSSARARNVLFTKIQ
ncbi:MAG: serine hydrolase domain-containing protein [bacterium]